MAYVNVKDWSVEQVTDWLKGLDNVILQYTQAFLNNGVNGQHLLNLRADDLEHLGVYILGHQEFILEAVEHLRNIHYELDKENLQMLALRLSCAANSLNRELQYADEDATMVQTQTMSDVHNIISTIKPLICWLDRSPFLGDKEYIDIKRQVLQLTVELATHTLRDIFSHKPVKSIRNICEKLTKLADSIIQEMKDPLILQPASLDLTTLKKKEQELGFLILPSNSWVHQIGEIIYGSPAHLSTKIEEGDEIVQVNYQTVVGWHPKKVMIILQESPPEIVLTLKKRPRHTKVYGQIYMKPYRLPSKKRASPYSRWNGNLPSPRLLLHDLPQISLPIRTPAIKESHDEPDAEICSSSSGSDSELPDSPVDNEERLYPPKPRTVLQRRNTITGTTPIYTRPTQALEQYWKLLKNQAPSIHSSSSYNLPDKLRRDDSMYMRDKSASCSHGLELSAQQRPTTVIGLASSRIRTNNSFKNDSAFSTTTERNKKNVNFDDDKVTMISSGNDNKPSRIEILDDPQSISTLSLTSLNNENIDFIDEVEDLQDRSRMTIETTSSEPSIQIKKIEVSVKSIKELMIAETPKPKTKMPLRDSALEDVHINNIIKKFDKPRHEEDHRDMKPKIVPRTINQKVIVPSVPQKPTALPRSSILQKVRGKLDKSHSAPAYDEEELSDMNLVVKCENIKSSDESSSQTTLKPTDASKDTERINYELGIPLMQNVYVDKVQSKRIPEAPKSVQDVPPKPPPRTNIPEPVRRKPQPELPAIDLHRSKSPAVESPTQKPLKDINIVKDTISKSNLSDPVKDTKVLDLKSKLNVNIVQNTPSPQPPAVYMRKTALHHDYSFDPVAVSTPLAKQTDVLKVDTQHHCHKSSLSDLNKIHKTSPTNIVARTIYGSKSKALKKKNTLLAKKRKVSVNEVSPGENRGYLYQRLRSKQTQDVQWEKRYFVLNGNCLYGFKTNDSAKAECYIVLAGFTVTIATEVKSRQNAFKVYHTGTIFYFSAENEESMYSWLDTISIATLSPMDLNKSGEQIVFSETDDDSDNETQTSSSSKNSSKNSTLEKSSNGSEGLRKFNSLKKFASKKRNDTSHAVGSTSLDRKWFFNKSSSSSSVSRNVLPVPTAQFRSYRKIPASSTIIGSFTSHVPNFSEHGEHYNISEITDGTGPNVHATISIESIPTKVEEIHQIKTHPERAPSRPPKFSNHLHASNPSICNVTEYSSESIGITHVDAFQTHPMIIANATITTATKSKTHQNENLAGFVTLEELMIRQCEEQKQKLPSNTILSSSDSSQNIENDMRLRQQQPTGITPLPKTNLIRPDVVYGEIPIRPNVQEYNTAHNYVRPSSDCSEPRGNKESPNSSSSCFGKRSGSLKTSSKSSNVSSCTASLTKTQQREYQQQSQRSGFLSSRQRSSSAKSLSGSNTKGFIGDERPYEMIYCPQTLPDVHYAQNRSLDAGRSMYHHNMPSQTPPRKGGSLKAARQYTPLTAPLTSTSLACVNSSIPIDNPRFTFDLNLDDKQHQSHKTTTTSKLKQFFSHHKDGSSRKKGSVGSILPPPGSPGMKRQHQITSKSADTSPECEIQWPTHHMMTTSAPFTSNCLLYHNTSSTSDQSTKTSSPAIDYPGLEYPPIFEPETYSLANPQSNIFRKVNKTS